MNSATSNPNNHLFNHILYCTDFSPEADVAFPRAVALATLAGSRLTLLHVVPEPEAQFWKTYIYEVDNVDDKAKADIDAKICAYQARLPATVGFRVVHRIGREDEEILAYAAATGIDLIVLARHPHSLLGNVFFGRLAEKIVRHAPCAVLIMPAAE